ncbi:MAG: PAS domain-containing sensor histidine kinase [Candidatus Obscuribacterales bacterium]|nr:PAS domain-containing sensor histidine kinase [Candidatus Obscuribacterales bacterium]
MKKEIRKAINAAPSTGALLYASIFDSCFDAIDFKTPDGVIAAWNPSAERLYGYRSDEIVGQHVSLLYSSDDFEEFASHFAEATKKLTKSRFQSSRLTKSGERIVVFMTLSPVVDHLGKLLGVSAISRDISGEIQMKKETERLERDREELLSVLSNDVKNSINQINRVATALGTTSVFERRDLENILVAIKRENDEFALIIDNLLTVYSLKPGIRLHFRKVKVAKLLCAVLKEMTSVSAKPKLLFTEPDDSSDLSVDADQKMLSRLLRNVLEWSMVRSKNEEVVDVSIRSLNFESSVEIAVTYIGRTHSAREIELIFSSRWREHNGAETGSMSGLGLFLARWTAEAHGGSLELDSSNGRNTFIITLPRVQEQASRHVDIAR